MVIGSFADSTGNRMSYTFTQPIYNELPRSITSLVLLMSKHANKAARGSRTKWHLTWHADRIDVTFIDELDWKHFDDTFLDECLEDLAYRDLVPHAEMILNRRRGSEDAREVLGGIADHLRSHR